MTALKKYTRLEASALWRAREGDQRREVIISIGEATLTIADMQDRPLTHWSLAAISRANPGQRPAIFHPDGDRGETLEILASEAQMIDALEKVRRAVDRTRPRPGRLRWLGVLASILLVAGLVFFWLPSALVSHTVSVVPAVKRADIGASLLDRIETLTGPACIDPAGLRALQKLRARLGSGPIHILPGTLATSRHLPGGIILLDRAMVEDFEAPDVAAGFILDEKTQAAVSDPLHDLLLVAGTLASFQLLTTGNLRAETLDTYARHILTSPRTRPSADALLPAFAQRSVRSTPYAYARDISGESVLSLIEADPMSGKPPVPLLGDADWLRLQNICGG
ncbi:MAG: hypothetical protein AAGF27_05780 [Pseudomonadota bacterium]